MFKYIKAFLFFTILPLSMVVDGESLNPIDLNPEISYVSTDGVWRDGDKIGRYRLIVRNTGWHHIRTHIFLQWVNSDQVNQNTYVIKSVNITEYSNGDWRYFNRAKFKHGKYVDDEYQDQRYVIYYENRGRETNQKAILYLGKPGEYRIDIKEEPFE